MVAALCIGMEEGIIKDYLGLSEEGARIFGVHISIWTEQ